VPESLKDLLLHPVGVAGDDAGEQVPRLQDEIHVGATLELV
jgi:hypothetical protein